MSIIEVQDAYGSRAEEYTAALGSIESMAAQDRTTITEWMGDIVGPVIDAGSGPGHWTKHLHDLGADIEGVDMVPEFVHTARDRFPEVPFRIGMIHEFLAPIGSLGGILSWYSIIHTPPEDISEVLGEFARCLSPGGSLLLGFFAGNSAEPFDHAIATAYFWAVPGMQRALRHAGFEVVETQTRTDRGSRPHAAIRAEIRDDICQ